MSELSYREVAAFLAVSEQTVRNRPAARKLMREEMTIMAEKKLADHHQSRGRAFVSKVMEGLTRLDADAGGARERCATSSWEGCPIVSVFSAV